MKRKKKLTVFLVSSLLVGATVASIAAACAKQNPAPKPAPSDPNNELQTAKTSLKLAIESSNLFSNSLSDAKYSTIKSKYDKLVADSNAVLNKSDASVQELQNALSSFNSKLEELRVEKQTLDSQLQTKEGAKVVLSTAVSSSTSFGNSLSEAKYTTLKQEYDDAVSQANAVLNNADSTKEQLESALSSFNSKIQSLRDKKQDIDSLLSTKAELKATIDGSVEFEASLADAKYAELKQEFTTLKDNANAVYNNADATTVQVREAITTFNSGLLALRTKKINLDSNLSSLEVAKNRLKTVVDNSQTFANSIVDVKYATIKSEYEDAKAKALAVYNKSDATLSEVQTANDKFQAAIIKLTQDKQAKDDENLSAEQQKTNASNTLQTTINEAQAKLNELADTKYSAIKQKLQTEVDKSLELIAKKEKTVEELRNQNVNLKQAIATATREKEAFDNEEAAKSAAITSFEAKLSEVQTFIESLNKNKYSEFKQAIVNANNTAKTVFDQKQTLSSQELREGLTALEQAFEDAKTKKEAVDNVQQSFSVTSALAILEDAQQESTGRKFKTLSFELTSAVALDNIDEIKNLKVLSKSNAQAQPDNSASTGASSGDSSSQDGMNSGDQTNNQASGSGTPTAAQTPSSENSQSLPEGYDRLETLKPLSVSFKLDDNTYKVLTVTFKVFENRTYKLKDIVWNFEENQTKDVAITSTNENDREKLVSGIANQDNEVSTIPDDSNNTPQRVEDIVNYANYEALKNALSPTYELSSYASIDTPLVLNNDRKHYLYVYKDEKLTKYIPNKISHNNELYTLKTGQDTKVNKVASNSEELSLVYTKDVPPAAANTNGASASTSNEKTFKIYVSVADFKKNDARRILNNNTLSVDAANSHDYNTRSTDPAAKNQNVLANLINGNPEQGSRWDNWHDQNTDQSNYNNQFTLNVLNNQSVLINQLDLNMWKQDNHFGGFVLPEEIVIETSIDGTTYTPVNKQDKKMYSDFGQHDNNSKELPQQFRTQVGSSQVWKVTINFEPTLAKYIRYKWKPRVKQDNPLQHYANAISELQFFALNNSNLAELKQQNVDYSKHKEDVLDTFQKTIDVFANLVDTTTNKYASTIRSAKKLKASFEVQKNQLLQLDNQAFLNQLNLFEEELKKVAQIAYDALKQNEGNDVPLENALKQTRSLQNEIAEFSDQFTSQFIDSSYDKTLNKLINELNDANSNANKTTNSLYNVADAVKQEFDKVKQAYESRVANETVLSIDRTSEITFKTISPEKYELTLTINHINIKEGEYKPLSLKLEGDSVGVKSSLITFDKWSVANDSPSPSQPAEVRSAESSDQPKTVTKKTLTFTISGQPETLRNVKFSKILLGDDEVAEIGSEYNAKLLKLTNAITNIKRTFTIGANTGNNGNRGEDNLKHSFSFELKDGLTFDANNSKVLFSLENGTHLEYNLTSSTTNGVTTYLFKAPKIDATSGAAQNALYLKTLRLNLSGSSLIAQRSSDSQTNPPQTTTLPQNLDADHNIFVLREQDNTDISWTPQTQDPKWHLKELKFKVFDVYAHKRGTRIDYYASIENPEGIIRTPHTHVLIHTGGNDVADADQRINYADNAPHIQHFSSLAWSSSKGNTVLTAQNGTPQRVDIGTSTSTSSDYSLRVTKDDELSRANFYKHNGFKEN